MLLFEQPFGINALVGLIALSGILMRNTLILAYTLIGGTFGGTERWFTPASGWPARKERCSIARAD